MGAAGLVVLAGRRLPFPLEQILDLVAYLQAGGKADNPVFK